MPTWESDKQSARPKPRGSKTSHQSDNPDQSKRFLEAAKEAEADETPKGADRAFRAVVPGPKKKAK
jgi:hypothetical protein